MSLQGYRVSATWYQGTSRLDALRTRRTVGFQEGAVKVRAPRGWLAGACKGLPTTGSSKVVRSRSREESEVASICGPARSSQGSPGSPYFSLRFVRLPHPVSMVLNSLQARFSDSSSAGTKQVGRTPWCCGGGPPAFLARSQRILPHVLASLLRDSSFFTPLAR